MKTIYFPNTIRPHLVTIAPMSPFTSKSTSKLRSALHFTVPAISIIVLIPSTPQDLHDYVINFTAEERYPIIF